MTKVFVEADDLMPSRESEDAAGWDLRAACDMKLMPGIVNKVPTGVVVEIPSGYYGRVAPRSGLALKKGVNVLAGVIDRNYRGVIMALLTCMEEVEIRRGQAIAQLIITAYSPDNIIRVESRDQLSDTSRGEKGFGSTDTKK